MSKKLTFLLITTFIIALALGGYFVVQEIRAAINITGSIEMLYGGVYNRILNLPVPTDAKHPFTKEYLRHVGNLYDSDGKSIKSWCEIQHFNWCDFGYPDHWCGDGTCDYIDEDAISCPQDCYVCFVAETQILMADGKYKNIADIQSGEYVLTRESEKSPKLVKAKVLDTYEHWYDRYFVINGSLEVTYHHRMFVNGEWKAVRDIEVGDKLLNKDNQEVVVESMEEMIKEEKFRVYNLKIEKYQTYFAGEFYVHNAKACFTPETQILMADGKYKPIKDVKEGDWVLTKENEKSDKMVSAKVAKTFEHTANSYLVINNELKVTDIHPVFVNGKWKQVGAIELGDKLLNEKSQEVIVESLELKRGVIKVYNLEVEGYETYFAGGFYVHNKIPENGFVP